MNAYRRRITIGLPLGLVLLAGCGYNTIQTLDEKVNQAEAQIKALNDREESLKKQLDELRADHEKLAEAVEEGARAILNLATSPAVEGQTGLISTGCMRQKRRPKPMI